VIYIRFDVLSSSLLAQQLLFGFMTPISIKNHSQLSGTTPGAAHLTGPEGEPVFLRQVGGGKCLRRSASVCGEYHNFLAFSRFSRIS
jgi:hypothetical protein